MIELNGIYKLKKIRNFESNNNDYKIIELVDDKYSVCEKLNGEDAGTKYLFLKEFFIDPENPDEIYSDIILVKDNPDVKK